MADEMARNPWFTARRGTNFSCYTFTFVETASGFQLQPQRIGGVHPLDSFSGEIFIKLDWSALAGNGLLGGGYSTYQIAPPVAAALMSTNFIPELNGIALAELPLHLIGHSRGGSLVCEISRLLGTHGVWVDHVTTLDPHPLNNDGFNDFPLVMIDASATLYQNVFYADNYWQAEDTLTNGKFMAGAFNRFLSGLTGGYFLSHGDVHLWYHGTIDWRNNATDTQATISSTERQTWWSPDENEGVTAGFVWSRIAGGNRFSDAEPNGVGNGRVSHGVNKLWDFGAGVAINRALLATNSGTWPNVLQFSLPSGATNRTGDETAFDLFWQSGQATNQASQFRIFLDSDFNPFNQNALLAYDSDVPATGTSSVGRRQDTFHSNPKNTWPGNYAVYARIASGGRTRYLYSQQLLTLLPAAVPPALTPIVSDAESFRVGVDGFPGQRIILQRSGDLVNWTTVATNTMAGYSTELSFEDAAGSQRQFYRALLGH